VTDSVRYGTCGIIGGVKQTERLNRTLMRLREAGRCRDLPEVVADGGVIWGDCLSLASRPTYWAAFSFFRKWRVVRKDRISLTEFAIWLRPTLCAAVVTREIAQNSIIS